jgi:hypothetical protein
MACHVFVNEVVYNGRLEELSLVGNYVLNAKTMAQITSIVEILGVALLLVETECHTNNLITGILQKQRRHGAIGTSTHPQQDSLLNIHSAKIVIKMELMLW